MERSVRNAGQLISISRRGLFNLEEARQILPIVRHITYDLSEKVDALIAQLESTPDDQKELSQSLENDINQTIHLWNEKIKKLGAIPKGLWLVDFEFGRGFYCWKFPEADILFWHTQEAGFSGRRPLEDLSLEKKEKQPTKTKTPDSASANRLPPREL
jgi:hypothetical protein